MSHYIQSIYDDARQKFEQAFEYMRQSVEEYKSRQGGADMPANAKNIYESRRRQLVTLANFYDAAEERLQEKEQEIQELRNQVRALEKRNYLLREQHGQTSTELETRIHPRIWLKMMLLVGNSDPVPLGAIIGPKEGRRQAQIEYAQKSQPNLYLITPMLRT